jgi:hypothetical protein
MDTGPHGGAPAPVAGGMLKLQDEVKRVEDIVDCKQANHP